jgi:hypothetical protein
VGGTSSSGTSGGSSGSTGSTGAGSSGAGSTSDSSSGGTGDLFDGGNYYNCPGVAVFPEPVISCPSETLDLSSQLVDVFACTIVGGGNISALDTNGIPYPGASAVSSSTDGTFDMCVPQQKPFTAQITASQYPTTYFGELQGVAELSVVQLPLLSSEALAAIVALVPNGLDQSLGLVVVTVDGNSQCGAAQAGWTIGLALPDGGSLPDGGFQLSYLSGQGIPTVGLKATQATGGAILYDIAPQASDFLLVTYQNPDAGACQPMNASLGLTGRVYVTGNSVSVFPVRLP